MKPVRQSRFGGPLDPPNQRGDCLSACIASILEIDLEEVPHFGALEPGAPLVSALQTWSHDQGLLYHAFMPSPPPAPQWQEDLGWCIIYLVDRGSTLGSGNAHGLVGWGGAPVFDPFDGSDGEEAYLKAARAGFAYFVPLDPAHHVRSLRRGDSRQHFWRVERQQRQR